MLFRSVVADGMSDAAKEALAAVQQEQASVLQKQVDACGEHTAIMQKDLDEMKKQKTDIEQLSLKLTGKMQQDAIALAALLSKECEQRTEDLRKNRELEADQLAKIRNVIAEYKGLDKATIDGLDASFVKGVNALKADMAASQEQVQEQLAQLKTERNAVATQVKGLNEELSGVVAKLNSKEALGEEEKRQLVKIGRASCRERV